MLSSRISNQMATQLSRGNLTTAYAKLVDLQRQISSGKQIFRPSDAPADTIRTLTHRSDLRRNTQYERNAQDAEGWLGTIDNTLVTAQNYLTKVRDLVLRGKDGSQSGNRDVIADEIDQLRLALIALGNTTYADRAVFAGTGNTQQTLNTTTGQPLAAVNLLEVRRPIADGETLVVNATNVETFGTYVGTVGGTYSGSVFEVLEKISTDLRNNDLSATGLEAALPALDTARQRMSIVQSAVGAKTRRVEDVLSRNLDIDGDLRHAISELEDVDMAKVLLDLRVQEANYQAALSVTAQVIQPSLVDFLR